VTTTNERRPGVNQGGEEDRGRSDADGTGPGRLDDPELLAEVGRVVAPAIAATRREHGQLAGVGTEQWWAASDDVKLSGVLILGMAWCVHDPEIAVRQRLRAMCGDLSEAHDWAAASRRPSHTSLDDRRAVPGPGVQSFDAAAAARWVATGSSAEGEGAA